MVVVQKIGQPIHQAQLIIRGTQQNIGPRQRKQALRHLMINMLALRLMMQRQIHIFQAAVDRKMLVIFITHPLLEMSEFGQEASGKM